MLYFQEELEHLERWKDLRSGLFRNTEPEVKLVAVTQPVDEFAELITTETLPGFTARESHESEGTYEDDLELNRKLISWEHKVPFEAVQFVFHTSGISKSLAGQWTRHRSGIGWTFRSTRYVSASGNCFVYPALEYLEDENVVKEVFRIYENSHEDALEYYNKLVGLGVKNQEARRIMTVDWATSSYVYVNGSALRHLFEMRLSKHAEWEIRRMCYLMFNNVCTRYPSLFEDLSE